MIPRSRSLSMLTQSRAQLFFILVLAIGLTGCSRTQPREHWWQFWRAKPTYTEQSYHPDEQILPPPPDILGSDDSQGDSSAMTMADAPPPPPAIEQVPENAPLREEASPVTGLETVHFAYDSDTLSDEARSVLNNNASWLIARPGYEVSIEGHCDEQGTAEYNLNLGSRRAKSVRAYLISRGVAAERLHTISYGEERPLDPTASEEAYSRNRRVQFLVY